MRVYGLGWGLGPRIHGHRLKDEGLTGRRR